MEWLKRMFGTKHLRDYRRLKPLVERIGRIEVEYQRLSDDELRAKTDEFRRRLAGGETLNDIMCEAFAAVKNACRRLVGRTVHVCGHDLVWDMVPFDVQVMGGIVLHEGKIAEMATGEGKTLVATMPLYLNALSGKNVHLVTVNDYLARRDAQWMGNVYSMLGISVGCIQEMMGPAERRAEYAKDVTYGTNAQFGFDYLRDNGMAWTPEQQVQRGYFYAIIDEVDSILIDEARTPLIISGPAPVSTHQFHDLKPKVDELVRRQRTMCNTLVQEAKELLDKGETERAQLKMYQVFHGMPKHKQLMHLFEDPAVRKLHEQIESAMVTDMRKEQARELREALFFTIDERNHDAGLTEKGCEALNPSDPEMFVLPDLVSAMSALDGDASLSEADRAKRRVQIQENFADRSERIHNVDQLIRAYCLYERDVEYVVQDNQVLIVDEFTGRILPGRRWSDGLHQAVEAKEGVRVERETQTLATITIQNYFRMYEKLAGMTGTAETEASEFRDIYKLDVVVIPTNRPCRRVDNNDVVYKTQREKFKALIDEITECHQHGQPVLVGTISVETSELLSRMLRRAKIPHNVLNAKNHEREAEIVTGAGQAGSVTIATNMAGRGTDIKLGEGVVWLARDIVRSTARLDDKQADGRSLREQLTEKPCGLHVIGSERHEARRIDRQLRGRCARQGDPGSSRFYVSLEDDLMRLFGSDRIAGIMGRLGLEEGQQLEHRWLNRSIETAQRRVEQQNYSIRKRTLEYDDVMNRQREIVYRLRGDIVRSEHVREHIYTIFEDAIVRQIEAILVDDTERTIQDFVTWAQSTFPIALRPEDVKRFERNRSDLAGEILNRARQAYDLKASLENPTQVASMERHIMLQIIDSHWQDYLRSMDALRQGVGLRAYGQRDPLVEYKREAFSMFAELMKGISLEISGAVFRAATSLDSFAAFLNALPGKTVHEQVSALGHAPQEDAAEAAAGPRVPNPEDFVTPQHRDEPKVGRNDPCPCGSGKKHKKCCGRAAAGA
jgi:preprotein translocase subunit SecA